MYNKYAIITQCDNFNTRTRSQDKGTDIIDIYPFLEAKL